MVPCLEAMLMGSVGFSRCRGGEQMWGLGPWWQICIQELQGKSVGKGWVRGPIVVALWIAFNIYPSDPSQCTIVDHLQESVGW